MARFANPRGARLVGHGIELLNAHWHGLRSRCCAICDANFPADEGAVHRGGELYHPDCVSRMGSRRSGRRESNPY